MRLPVSVVMITKNEEKHLARALASCGFADEIVVVDACSTDQTREIAKQYGAKIFERKWTNFGDQRNYSLSVAANDWVLVVDADEKVSEQLKNWMEQIFRKKSIESNGFKIRRKEYFLGQEITGACWNPSYQDRFFRKSKAKYVGVIHEYPEAEGGFVRAPEEAYLEHNPNVTVESFFNKNE
ncbi:MAG: glycosyltransferase family 2 protein [Oligoflexia bacterium]|nr:glycosyltransferase family 2 protein [Oligoflexia bacterium]